MGSLEDQLQFQLDQEFGDRGEDLLGELNALLEGVHIGNDVTAEGLGRVRQIVHSLKGLGASFGYGFISVLCHRFEDYLAELESIGEGQLRDVQIFIDRLEEAVHGRVKPEGDEIARFVRDLPGRPGFDSEDIEPLDIEIMLVLPAGAATRFVTAELEECGYRVVNVISPAEAMEQTARKRPDLVVASAALPGLSGIDLACALAAMPATEDIPVARLTSLDRDDESLRRLPAKVPIIRKGGDFGDDIAKALSKLGII